MAEEKEKNFDGFPMCNVNIAHIGVYNEASFSENCPPNYSFLFL